MMVVGGGGRPVCLSTREAAWVSLETCGYDISLGIPRFIGAAEESCYGSTVLSLSPLSGCSGQSPSGDDGCALGSAGWPGHCAVITSCHVCAGLGPPERKTDGDKETDGGRSSSPRKSRRHGYSCTPYAQRQILHNAKYYTTPNTTRPTPVRFV